MIDPSKQNEKCRPLTSLKISHIAHIRRIIESIGSATGRYKIFGAIFNTIAFFTMVRCYCKDGLGSSHKIRNMKKKSLKRRKLYRGVENNTAKELGPIPCNGVFAFLPISGLLCYRNILHIFPICVRKVNKYMLLTRPNVRRVRMNGKVQGTKAHGYFMHFLLYFHFHHPRLHQHILVFGFRTRKCTKTLCGTRLLLPLAAIVEYEGR